jgi:hypothetical protein
MASRMIWRSGGGWFWKRTLEPMVAVMRCNVSSLF